MEHGPLEHNRRSATQEIPLTFMEAEVLLPWSQDLFFWIAFIIYYLKYIN
jgi:hypothetical protein